jgi:phage host-nuclease inhibitor protein Gam
MARKRIEGTALVTYDDADNALRKIGELDREISLIETAGNEAIDRIKAETKAAVEPVAAIKSVLERQLKEFAEARRVDFASTRTRELTFGSIGFRRSTSVVIKKVGDTLAALKALGLATCIRTKGEPDKEAMKELDSETLASVGAALQTKDTFGYEINRQRIADLERAA